MNNKSPMHATHGSGSNTASNTVVGGVARDAPGWVGNGAKGATGGTPPQSHATSAHERAERKKGTCARRDE